MANIPSLKEQRDRFLAFAFASADLFIEVSEEGKITFALGAAKGLTGVDDRTLLGKNWLELFSAYEQVTIQHKMERAKPGMRLAPMVIGLSETLTGRNAIVTGIKMPGSNKYYLTLGVNSSIMSKLADALDTPDPANILDRQGFLDKSQEVLNFSRSMGQSVDITFLICENLDPSMQDTLQTTLLTHSINTNSAAHLGGGRYVLIHDAETNADTILKTLDLAVKEQDPSNDDLRCTYKTVHSKLHKLKESQTARALLYTVNEFIRTGTEMSIDNLNTVFETYKSANQERLEALEKNIERVDFTFVFQPVVDLETLDALYYETLCRFPEGDTQELVMLAEDSHLTAKMDLAMCERVVNHIRFKAGGTTYKFSMNVSQRSIQDPTFLESFIAHIEKDSAIAKRLLIEITESDHFEHIGPIKTFIETLRTKGFQIILDDFGTDTKSLKYLDSLPVHAVKIGGHHIRKLQTSARERNMLETLSTLCRKRNIDVVAKQVDHADQLRELQNIGITQAQGYVFGKPDPQTNYQKPSSHA